MSADDPNGVADNGSKPPGAEPSAQALPALRPPAAAKSPAWPGVGRALGNLFQEPPSAAYFLSRWWFLRWLGLVYLIAFVSLWTQVNGLIGHNGILPAVDFLDAVRRQAGPARYWLVPTLCWFNPSDLALHIQCAVGVWASILLLAGLAPGPAALLCWALYLSLATVGQAFLGFQWDILLLEAGLLAVFYAPWRLRPGLSRETAPSRVMLWLLRWLLFRLMFLSGVVKLASGDPAWSRFTALTFHYETQPLPTWIGWYAHQLPSGFHAGCVLAMFFIELVVPWWIFAGRRMRSIAGITFVGFQGLIALTGNYGFFNLLTVALCVPLFDDGVWRRLAPRRRPAALETVSDHPAPPGFRRFLLGGVAALILAVSGLQIYGRFFGYGALPEPARQLVSWAAPLRSVNTYGLFAVMTNPRMEIVIEGSNDREHWRPYEFKWKPGDPQRAPGFVAPRQPRLDWQMWFAALGRYQNNPWFMNCLACLLQGSPPVLALLGHNPFPGQPPRYLRAVLYEYHFTRLAERRADGAWWHREWKGLYCPVVFLQRDPDGPRVPPNLL